MLIKADDSYQYMLVGVCLFLEIFSGGHVVIYMVIGIAGALGVLLRYYVGIWIPTSWILDFPLGSLLINLVGSFFLSWFTVWSTCYSSMPTWFKTGITPGFIRSFTTFSTLQWESIQMRNEKNSKNFFGTLGLLLGWNFMCLSWICFR